MYYGQSINRIRKHGLSPCSNVSLSHCVMDGLGQSIDRMRKHGLSPCSNVSLSHCVMDGLGQSIDRMRKNGLSPCSNVSLSHCVMDGLWTKQRQNEKTWTESMFQCVSLSLCHGWIMGKA